MSAKRQNQISGVVGMRNFGHKFSRRPRNPANFLTRALCQELATMPPVMADWHRGTQIESSHGGNDIEPSLAFDAKRLKGE